MANVLIAWELGWGLGHLAMHREPALRLCADGHRVVFAARHPGPAQGVFGDTSVEVVQAPQMPRSRPGAIEMVLSYGQLLHNMGYAHAEDLGEMVGQWRSLIDDVDPDVLVADHSPTALLASRGHRTRRVIFGNGFACPPDQQPVPSLLPDAPGSAAAVAAAEKRVMQCITEVLSTAGLPSLSHLGRLLSDVDETVLTTFSQLDHYPERPNAEYWGDWTRGDFGCEPNWPPGTGSKIFAYLKPFGAAAPLLKAIETRGHPTLVYGPALPKAVREASRTPNIHISEEPFAIDRIAESCDLAILNGGHGATIKILLAGKPTLQIPLVLEQGLTGLQVEGMGVGLQRPGSNPKALIAALDEMLRSPRFAGRARAFAEHYRAYDPAERIDAYTRRIEGLLARPASRA